MTIRSNLKNIIDDRGLSIRQVSRDTGLQFESVRRLYNNETRQYPKDLLSILCEYFDIPLSELLKDD